MSGTAFAHLPPPPRRACRRMPPPHNTDRSHVHVGQGDSLPAHAHAAALALRGRRRDAGERDLPGLLPELRVPATRPRPCARTLALSLPARAAHAGPGPARANAGLPSCARVRSRRRHPWRGRAGVLHAILRPVRRARLRRSAWRAPGLLPGQDRGRRQGLQDAESPVQRLTASVCNVNV
jgi:hypothetical protein